MRADFIANPPLPVKWRSLPQHLWLLARRAGWTVWQIVVPFKFRPEQISPFPAPDQPITIEESQVEQCQWIFDRVEERRANLEQKAQSTFSLMVFFVPLLSSLFVFVTSRGIASGTRTITLALVCISGLFLLLGFISAIRAIGVKENQTLMLDSVLHEDGKFRKYSAAFRAQGLLYCSSMNTAMNDHLAQFVKGAHTMTAGAVVFLLLAAVPTSMAFLRLPSSPWQTQTVDPVTIHSPALSEIERDVSNLKSEVKELSKDGASQSQLKALEKRVSALDESIRDLQQVTRATKSANARRQSQAPR
jgi:hypothetical protein